MPFREFECNDSLRNKDREFKTVALSCYHCLKSNSYAGIANTTL